MPKKETKKNKRGFARIEFLAVEPEVKELLKKGHTIQSAYDEFVEAGKVSMSYAMFRRYTIEGVPPAITQQRKVKKKVQVNTQEAENQSEDNSPTRVSSQQSKNLGITTNQSFKSFAKQAELDEDYI